jgi:hypothetical protein
MKPYQYRNRNITPPEYTRENVQRTGDQEVLTGRVQGMDASDLEERVARAMDRLEIEYQFRVRVTSDALGDRRLTREFANVRGEIEMDFLVSNGRVTPIMVDGQVSHFLTPAQAEEDQVKTNVVNEFGKRLGWREVVRIPFWKLVNQDMADRTVRDIVV